MEPEVKVTAPDPLETAETAPKQEEKTVPFTQYQKLQQELSARDRKLQEAEEKATRLHERLDRLEENQAQTLDLLEAQAGVTETEKPSRVAALKRQREKPAANPVIEMQQREIQDLLAEANINDKDPQLEKAALMWAAGKTNESVREVRSITRAVIKLRESGDTEKHIQAEVNKRVQEAIEKAGLKKFPGGEPAGGALAYRQIADQFTENPNDPVIREAYLKARRARGL